MSEITYKDLPMLTDKAQEKIISVVEKNPGLYSPASLVGTMERGDFGGYGRVVTYEGTDGYPHFDATGAVALWDALGRGLIHLSNDFKLYPENQE